MRNKKIITHTQLIEYIKNQQMPMVDINELRKNHPAYHTLFLLIDKSLEHINVKPELLFSDETNIDTTDKILLDLLSGNLNTRKAEIFLSTLYSHPDYYQRILDTFDTEQIENISLDEILIADNSNFLELLRKTISQPKIKSKALIEYTRHAKNGLNNLFVPSQIPKLGLLALFVFMISIAAIKGLYKNQSHHSIYAKYFQSASLPVDYFNSTSRGSLIATSNSSVIDKISDQFKMAMSDYLVMEYTSSLNSLELILSSDDINSLNNNNSIEGTQLLRDIHFFAGISSLALAGPSLNKSNLNSALSHFTVAHDLVEQKKLKGGDREFFFLGLTYDLLGNNSRSLEYLGRVQEQSIYYNDSKNQLTQHSNR